MWGLLTMLVWCGCFSENWEGALFLTLGELILAPRGHRTLQGLGEMSAASLDTNQHPTLSAPPELGSSTSVSDQQLTLAFWTCLTNISLFKQMFLCVLDCYSSGNLALSFTKGKLSFSFCKMLGFPNTQITVGEADGSEKRLGKKNDHSALTKHFQDGPLVLCLWFLNTQNLDSPMLEDSLHTGSWLGTLLFPACRVQDLMSILLLPNILYSFPQHSIFFPLIV